MLDKLEGVANGIIIAAISAIGTGVYWLIRRVFTNQKQVEMLQRDLANRDRQRCEDREKIKEISDSVKRIEGWFVEGRDK